MISIWWTVALGLVTAKSGLPWVLKPPSKASFSHDSISHRQFTQIDDINFISKLAFCFPQCSECMKAFFLVTGSKCRNVILSGIIVLGSQIGVTRVFRQSKWSNLHLLLSRYFLKWMNWRDSSTNLNPSLKSLNETFLQLVASFNA